MRLLIIGGTGAMGSHLSELAAAKGAQVSVTTRRELSSQKGIEYITGDSKDSSFIKEVMCKGWDCVVDFMVYTTESFQKSLPLLLGNTHQYVYLSSSRVYAESNEPLVETSPRLLDVCQDQEYLATDEYALAKARQENLLNQSGKQNWTIIRPYITYAEERLQLGVFEKEAWLYRLLKGRAVVLSRDIAERETTLTYGRDVAKAISGLLGVEKVLGETFHITSSHVRKWQDIWDIYRKCLQAEAGIRPQAKFVGLNDLSKIHTGPYQIFYDRLFNRVFDNSKLLSIIGDSSFIEPEEGLSFCLKKFLCHKNFNQINTKAEALKDRMTKTHAKFGEFGTIRKKINYFLYRRGLKA
jgi:nucleoside-diphosphate-sugar epimerase